MRNKWENYLLARGYFHAICGGLCLSHAPIRAGARQELQEETVFVLEGIGDVGNFPIVVVPREAHGVVGAGRTSLTAIADGNRAHVNVAIAIYAEIRLDALVRAAHHLQAHLYGIRAKNRLTRNIHILELEQGKEHAEVMYQQVKRYVHIAATFRIAVFAAEFQPNGRMF